MKKDDTKRYSVFVGDFEVNDFFLDLSSATDLADDYLEDGYDEVWIRVWSDAELKEQVRKGEEVLFGG